MSKPTTTNRALQGAYHKGMQAAKDGQPVTANPYGDDRTWHGGVTWARAFWKIWREGWEDGQVVN